MGNCDAEIDCEVNRVIDQILQENRLESMGLDSCPDPCNASCEEVTEEPNRNCAVETSSRFSIRILEALRAVQRKKSTRTWASSTMEEVVQYIRRHYHYDGDLCSQVETALDQVTRQGFVLKMGVNRYHLMGPFACSVRRPPVLGSSNRNRNRANCGAPRPSSCRRRRRRRPGTPIANSTLGNSDFPEPLSMDRLSAVSELEDLQSAAFQNRSNRERSLMRGVGAQPLNEDYELSILDEMHAPALDELIRRPGGGGGRGQVVPNYGADEIDEEIHRPPPNEPVQIPDGCCDRGDVVQDQSLDENVGEIQFPFPNGVVRRPGGCGARGSVVQEHSSDENMYCEEPVADANRGRQRCQHPERRRRRDSSSSRSSSKTVTSRCATRGSSRNTLNSSSDADVSDETDGAKPWVRNCQNQQNRIRPDTRRGRRCSSCVHD